MTNPKRAAYNHIYNKTTISVDKLFSTKNDSRVTNIVQEQKLEDILVVNLNEKLPTINKTYYRGLKTYIKEKDYELASTVYDKIFLKLKENADYINAIDVLICAMYLRIYSMLPSDGILFDVDYYEKHLSKLRKYIKKIPKDLRNEIINIDKIEEISIIALNKYFGDALLDAEKTSKFIECLKKYL